MPNNNTTPEKILDIGGTEYLWGKIKDYQRDNRYIYSVKGTQTQSTNVWTGKIEINQLYNGLTIAYYLPYAGNSSNVTLNLTLGNNTTTGAVDVYLTGTTRLTNQYGAGSVILLTYWSSGSIKVAGTTTTNNRWLRADYDANTITTATTTGSGNAVTSISASNGALTVTKGSTFLTAHPTITTTTDTTSTGSPSHGGTFTTIDSVTRDTNGHVTKVNTKTITLPSDSNTDTKVNVTLDTTTKAYILGTSTTPTSTAKAVTSISDTGVYLDTTAGRLRATTYGITNGNYVNILSSSTLSANATQTFPSTGGTLLNTGTTSYTQTVTSSATNAYEIGKIKINGTETTIYGKYTDTNTDTKVAQNNTTANAAYRVLLSYSSNDTNETNTARKSSGLTYNPSTGVLGVNGYTVSGTSNSSYNFDDFSTIKRFSTSSNGQDNGWSTIVTANGIAKLQDSNTSSVYVTRHIPVSSTTAYDPPPWYAARHSVGLMFANQNQVAIMSMASNNSVPLIKFGATGGGPNGTPVADGTGPASPNGVGWYFGLTGTNGTTYNLDTHHPTIEMESDTGSFITLNHNDTFAVQAVGRDDNGHVISTDTKTYTLVANKVTQTNTTSNSAYRLLLSYGASDTTVINTTYKNSSLTFNPSTSVLTAGNTVKLHAEDPVATVTSADISISANIINDGVPIIDIRDTLNYAGVRASSFYGELNGTISSNTTATTQSVTDSSTKVATTKFVKDAITDSRVIHSAIGTAGQSGWVKIATMKHTKTYNNAPITLTIVQRGNIQTYRLHILFSSANSTDPSLNTFTLTTDVAWTASTARAYMIKSATSTWDLYVYKLDTYESISVTEFSFGSHSSSHMTWTWTDTQVAASAITGGTEATKKTLVTTDDTLEKVRLYTATATGTTSGIKCVPFLHDSAANLGSANKLYYSTANGFNYQFRTGQESSSPSSSTDGADVLILGNNKTSGVAQNSAGILKLFSRYTQGVQIRANKTSASAVVSVALPAKAHNSVLMSEIIMYEYSSGDKVSTYTSATYSTQEFAYFKVFVSLNASNSGYSCYDVIYNNASTLNEFALAWGKNTSGTGTVTLSTIMIQVSKSNNKYTFTATTSNSFSVTGSTTSAVTSPTVYIKKIIGVICESYDVEI